MAVYPFYIESIAEGRKSPIAGGCKRKDGLQQTTIYQREDGNIITAFKIEQASFLLEDGRRLLVCTVYNRSGEKVATEETYY